MSEMKRARCVRVYYARPDHVLNVLNAVTRQPDRIDVPRLGDLPAGYEVESVTWDHLRGMFTFLVSHPSFEPLEEYPAAPPPDALPFVIRNFETVRLARYGLAVPLAEDEVWRRLCRALCMLDKAADRVESTHLGMALICLRELVKDYEDSHQVP